MFSRLSRYAIMSVIIPLWLATLVIQTRADALPDLNKAFLDAYGLAASQSLAELRRRAPTLVICLKINSTPVAGEIRNQTL